MESEDLNSWKIKQLDRGKDKYITCPVCQGKGQVTEKMVFPLLDNGLKTTKINTNEIDNSEDDNLQENIKLKSPNTVLKLPFLKQKLSNLSKPKNILEIGGQETTIKRSKKHIMKPQSAYANNRITERGDYVELLPPPTTLRHPVDAIKYSLMQFTSENWEIVMQGMSTMIQVSRTQPFLLEPHMTKVNQTLCNLLHNMRSHVARFACQAAKEFFRTMQSATRPEFDEIVQCLLQRTADMNKFIRHDANDALDAMITYIPPINSVRSLVEKGPSHKNALVRTSVARLLVCIVSMIEVNFLMTLPVYKETRKRVFNAAALLMTDPNMTTRNTIKKLFEMLIKDENFNTLFPAEVDKLLLKRIDKPLVCLKYKQSNR